VRATGKVNKKGKNGHKDTTRVKGRFNLQQDPKKGKVGGRKNESTRDNLGILKKEKVWTDCQGGGGVL